VGRAADKGTHRRIKSRQLGDVGCDAPHVWVDFEANPASSTEMIDVPTTAVLYPATRRHTPKITKPQSG
jgi:hypothetical protein